jgi:hypothetical protein
VHWLTPLAGWPQKIARLVLVLESVQQLAQVSLHLLLLR